MVDSTPEMKSSGATNSSRSATLLALPIFIALFCLGLITFDTESVEIGKHTLKDYSRLTRKVVEFNKSDLNPDVLLIGSSLSLTPIIRADQGGFPDVSGVRRKLMVHDYHQCTYLEREIQNISSHRKEIFNLSLPGAMVSDFYVTLHSAIASGKRPSTVVLALAPRDFVSNVKQDFRSNFAYKTLESFDDVDGTWLSRFQLGKNLISLRNLVERDLLLFRSETTRILCNATSEIITPHANVPSNSDLQDEETLNASECDQRVTDVYRTHFNPPNFKLLKAQSAYLEAIMRLGDKYGFETVLINMPTRSDMQAIIRPDLLASYNDTLKNACERHHCRLLEGQALCTLKDSDFVDLVHLDTEGARSLLKQVARKLTIAKPDDMQL